MGKKKETIWTAVCASVLIETVRMEEKVKEEKTNVVM